MFLIEICANLAEFVLRLAPKSWQRLVEPDSVLGVALGLVIAFVGIWGIVAVIYWARSYL